MYQYLVFNDACTLTEKKRNRRTTWSRVNSIFLYKNKLNLKIKLTPKTSPEEETFSPSATRKRFNTISKGNNRESEKDKNFHPTLPAPHPPHPSFPPNGCHGTRSPEVKKQNYPRRNTHKPLIKESGSRLRKWYRNICALAGPESLRGGQTEIKPGVQKVDPRNLTWCGHFKVASVKQKSSANFFTPHWVAITCLPGLISSPRTNPRTTRARRGSGAGVAPNNGRRRRRASCTL